MPKPWFETWFDSPYYHILYGHRDENEAKRFIAKLIEFLAIPGGSRVIDIGCGRGRHARFLSEMNYEVTGIDLARSSIDFASQYESKNLHFFCFDKRKVFRKGEYDLALNLFTSYGYLKNRSELEIALKSMSANLKDRGIFVLDYLNEGKIKHLDFHEDVVNNGGIEFKVKKHIEGHQILKDIEVKDGSEILHFREEVHLITLEEFRELFESASLEILHTFGDYQLNAYDRIQSDRLILIARKT